MGGQLHLAPETRDAFGVGHDVNTYLLDRLSALGIFVSVILMYEVSLIEFAYGHETTPPLLSFPFLVGLALPLMSVAKWHFWDHEYSVLEATSELLDEGEPLLAAAVLLFVVLLPLTRFAGLIALRWWSTNERAVRAVVLLDNRTACLGLLKILRHQSPVSSLAVLFRFTVVKCGRLDIQKR